MLPVLVVPDGNLGFGFFLFMKRLFIVIVCVYDVCRGWDQFSLSTSMQVQKIKLRVFAANALSAEPSLQPWAWFPVWRELVFPTSFIQHPVIPCPSELLLKLTLTPRLAHPPAASLL